MIAKGHDYQNIGLVAVLDADSRLYSADFRAAERLFAQLVQVAGRSGRSGTSGQAGGDIYIETQYPESPVFQYLLRHDVDGFLALLLLLSGRRQSCHLLLSSPYPRRR